MSPEPSDEDLGNHFARYLNLKSSLCTSTFYTFILHFSIFVIAAYVKHDEWPINKQNNLMSSILYQSK